MKRSVALPLGAVLVVLVTVWSGRPVGEPPPDDPSRAEIVAARRTIARLSELLAEERVSSAPLEQQLHALRGVAREHEALFDILFSTPSAGGPFELEPAVVGRHRSRFAPAGARITAFLITPRHGSLPPQVVVRWSLKPGDDVYPLEEGVFVWRGVLLTPQDTRTEWRLEWSIVLPHFHGLPAFIGRTTTGWLPNLSGQRAVPVFGDGFSARTGEVTGDGYPEVLVVDASGGSGGCGTYFMLSRDGGRLRQILHRSHCEGGISMIGGLVHIDGALYPDGCERAHGCGRYSKVLRWNGDGWDVVGRTSELDDPEYWA